MLSCKALCFDRCAQRITKRATEGAASEVAYVPSVQETPPEPDCSECLFYCISVGHKQHRSRRLLPPDVMDKSGYLTGSDHYNNLTLE